MLLLTLISTTAFAQDGGLAEWIIRTNAHRLGGYATLALAGTTVTLGLLGVPVHPYLGYATAGFAATASVMGTIAYADRARYFWPHPLLNAVATTGFILNAFLLEGGSAPHIATGIASATAMAGAYLSIVLMTR